ncbi:malonate decarboxylase holo-ACP synthase [Paraburkholderia flava]|uniref:malonate decarboxylase holo-ACP synthase n=1 Tax=Paraburkholderia flava TaxID=2547393 RepID=UPI0010603229|nr:malonate decarboxylase holo-ACP synthase [Paraburkholderia flava]
MRDSAVASFAADVRCRAHDLLRLRRLAHTDDEPAWLRDAWSRAPFAVVRRALAKDGFVAIGVRGTTRAQRYGMWAASVDIEQRLAPEDLVNEAVLTPGRDLPAFAALALLLRDATCLRQFAWGPTGSAGFELATRQPTVTASSDLDLLIRTPQPLSLADAQCLVDELQHPALAAGTRIDAQLETPAGGVALAEYAASKSRVLARSEHGPQLVDDPWHHAWSAA